jgi:SAM-dependent methyltransferase
LDQEDKENILNKYNKRFLEFGGSPKTIGWPKKRHKLRYHILLSHWDLEDTNILDFGCGFGDMFGYCKEKVINVNYSGIDINKLLVAEGVRKYPKINLKVRNAFDQGLENSVDYIFSSGVHNMKIKNNEDFIKKTFELFDKFALKGFALNFLSSHVDYKETGLYYSDPSKILNLALSYSNKVFLNHSYMPYEFTIFVDKQNDTDKLYNIFSESIPFL